MRRLLSVLVAICATPLAALELKLSGFYDLNRPASLEYDPAFCGLWIANEGPEVILVTLDGLELRRFGSDLSRIRAVTLEGENLIVADGFGVGRLPRQRQSARARPRRGLRDFLNARRFATRRGGGEITGFHLPRRAYNPPMTPRFHIAALTAPRAALSLGLLLLLSRL